MIFKLLIYGVVFYYLFKFIARIFGVFIIKKAAQQFTNQDQYSTNQQTKKEGEIYIKTKPKDKKKHVTGGDYVDFEEVN